MFSLIRLAFLYCVFGIGILFVQFNNTPCSAPVVFDDGAAPLGPPIDMLRLGADEAYRWRIGKLVVFWLPRMVDLVGIRGMPFPDYLFGSQCRKLAANGTPQAPTAPEPMRPAGPVVAAPSAVAPAQPLRSEPPPPEPLPRPRS